MTDDDLELFEANGAPPLPPTVEHGYTAHDGANIWHASFGAGSPVTLLHGGLGHSGNWGHQVPALTEHDEFIKSEHSAYLAKSIPNATQSILSSVSHFAPLQRPETFNAELQDFLGTIT
jgi:pimeloyl-ACP methyl ester carboxylesterase